VNRQSYKIFPQETHKMDMLRAKSGKAGFRLKEPDNAQDREPAPTPVPAVTPNNNNNNNPPASGQTGGPGNDPL